MEVINEFIRKRLRFLIANPFITAGIFALIFSSANNPGIRVEIL